MLERSLIASQAGIQKAKKALTGKGWTQQELADELEITRQPVSKFFTGKTVKRQLFVQICEKLQINWEEIAIEYERKQESSEAEQDNSSDIDALVQEVRQKISSGIEERCGSMRVLDMTQPIELNDIYTDVHILEKITGRQRKGVAELIKECTNEDFERFGLGTITEERVPGLEVVQRCRKLQVLGKPGAGKTTFLKSLAIQCIRGEFQTDKVPIFITLKQFTETQNQPELIEFIIQQQAKYAITEKQISELLNSGRLLFLLDGLDEVREEDSSRIIKQIEEFSRYHSTNQFVITCRIAAREYTFEQFTEVEVADFDDKQIQTFCQKWFQREESDIAEHFIQQLKSNEPIKELATNPLLLTLLCLEFQDSGDFPADRAELYNRAIHTLLRKWDTKRRIVRDEVYKKLSVRHKEDLLSYIAWTTFEGEDYFFKQRDIKQYISQYIRNLPEAQTDPDALQVDSEIVLKSIEAQHGLLVERAIGIYSFSHLTFQEYFTAREVVYSPDLKKALQSLVSHISEKRWREVFLLTAGMLKNADDLLQLMKQEIDTLVASDEKIQQYLNWAARAVDREGARADALARALDGSSALQVPELKQLLEELKAQLPALKSSENDKKEWWSAKGLAWVEHFRAVMIKHRNIGHDWQFSEQQTELLNQYYYANKLLADCLNSECYLSREVRQEIENTLLLPIVRLYPIKPHRRQYPSNAQIKDEGLLSSQLIQVRWKKY